jgi:hypothetical protein
MKTKDLPCFLDELLKRRKLALISRRGHAVLPLEVRRFPSLRLVAVKPDALTSQRATVVLPQSGRQE